MGLILAVILGGAVWFALWRTRALSRPAMQLVGAALLFGLSGYAFQGRPGLRGSPASERPVTPLPPVLPIELAGEFYGRFNGAEQWLIIANSYCRGGDSGEAVAALKSGLRARPTDSELWTALGNALVLHGGGQLSPAAQLAFERSFAHAPRHPGPPFFYGLALLQQGRPEQTLALWKEAARRGRPDASWQRNLRLRTAMLESLISGTADPRRPPIGG